MRFKIKYGRHLIAALEKKIPHYLLFLLLEESR